MRVTQGYLQDYNDRKVSRVYIIAGSYTFISVSHRKEVVGDASCLGVPPPCMAMC